MSFRDFLNSARAIAATESERVVNTVVSMANYNSQATRDWNRIQNLQIRRALRESITQLFDELYYSPSRFVNHETARENGIKVLVLDLNKDGRMVAGIPYFKPRSLRWFNLHQVDPDHRGTKIQRQETERNWTAAECKAFSQSEVLSTTLCNEFSRCERIKPDESYRLDIKDQEYDLEKGYSFQETYTLEELSGWMRKSVAEPIEDNKYIQPTLSGNADAHTSVPEWSSALGGAWMRDDSKPHLTFIMQHDMPPSEELLSTEVMTMLGMIRGRLARHTLQEHNVVPVTAVSCMNEFAARVLQAHYSEGQLIIFKSKFYFFDNPTKRDDNINLFVLYLASEPVGNTVG
ncbi:hypothetical protein BDV06DRAFT_222607 [Aspergillus oleicola]